ncbi:MAG TPA: hypothetical protein PKL97_05520, partial [Candidatus Omnitrophota bacterium]|nr:hypothetical protein [Candidatus Omnitrophota bacterium]
MGYTASIPIPDLTVKHFNRKEALCVGATRLFALLPLCILVFIMSKLIQGGAGTVTWGFLSEVPKNGMTEGGIFPCIFGTLAITLLMIAMALPLGIGAAIYLVEYAGQGLGFRVIRAAVNNLAGVPSIIFGLFGVGFFILFVGRNIDHVLRSGLLFG